MLLTFVLFSILLCFLSLLSVVIYKRTKKLVSKVYDLEIKNTNLISKIESRISKTFEEFDSGKQKEDWLLIISYSRKDLLEQTIRTAKSNEPNVKILVVDNGSSKELLEDLQKMFYEGLINKLLFNHNQEVSQWQKSFSISQAYKLLSLESVRSITICDDDILVEKPWINDSRRILKVIPEALIVSLMTDDRQEKIHLTKDEKIVGGELVKLKTSFIGTFFYIPVEAIKVLGLPPLNEGLTPTEDWYYSNLIEQKGWMVATVNRCQHLGYDCSIREKVEKDN
jgi:hypothetical protein